MASLFQKWPEDVRLLDPGAGIGSLTEAFVSAFLDRARPSSRVSVSAYEIEPILVSYLTDHLRALENRGRIARLGFRSEIVERDFIREGSFSSSFGARKYTHVILNPPYKKIGGSSEYRKLLRG